MKRLCSTVVAGFLALTAAGQVRKETVEYMEGDTLLQGLVVYDEARPGKRPGVLLVHQWKGLGE